MILSRVLEQVNLPVANLETQFAIDELKRTHAHPSGEVANNAAQNKMHIAVGLKTGMVVARDHAHDAVARSADGLPGRYGHGAVRELERGQV